MKLLGRWGRNTPSVVFFALRAPELNSFQRLKILVWRSQKFCFRMRRNFLDTSLIWRDVRRPRGEEGGSGGTEEAGTSQTRGDSAQDASPLCRCWFRRISWTRSKRTAMCCLWFCSCRRTALTAGVSESMSSSEAVHTLQESPLLEGTAGPWPFWWTRTIPGLCCNPPEVPNLPEKRVPVCFIHWYQLV